MDPTLSTYDTNLNPGEQPSAWYFSSEDSLRVIVRTAIAVTVTMEGRFLDWKDVIHPFVQTVVPTATDRSANLFLFPQTYGWLMNLTARVTSGTPETGQTFVHARIVRGQGAAAINIGTIMQGYVTTSLDLAYPGSPIVSSIAPPGLLTSLAITAPAAGAEWSITVPTRARWNPLAVNYTLTTAVAVANRESALIIDDGANLLVQAPSRSTQAASLAVVYSWFRTPTPGAGTQDTSVVGPLPDLRLAAGMRLRSLTKNLQAADQYSNLRLLTEEWIED